MTSPTLIYVITILILICLNSIAALGFNLQFAEAGIVNLAYIMLVAVGAYMTGIAAVGPPHPGDITTHYIGGFQWAFPWDLLFGIACAVVFALLLGLVALRRLRHDYLALALVSILQGMQILVGTNTRLFNGITGITGVPAPGGDLPLLQSQLVFLGVAVVCLVLTYTFLSRITRSPLGRVLKAIREDEEAAASLGKYTVLFKLTAFAVGGGIAGLSGGLFAMYAGGWSSTAWLPQEGLILLASVIIGGRGRNLGVVVGTIVTVGVIQQLSGFLPLPQGLSVTILPQLQVMLLGALIIVFLWLRPEGILPEQKEKFEKIGLDRVPVVGAGASAAIGAGAGHGPDAGKS
jgi:branched-chain amino acid transport system permease protein